MKNKQCFLNTLLTQTEKKCFAKRFRQKQTVAEMTMKAK